MSDKGAGAAVVVAGVAGLFCLGLLAVSCFISRREGDLFAVGDVLWCDLPEEPGYFTVLDKRNGEYRIGEGSPPIDDLGWWSENALLTSPWLCRVT